MSQQLEAEHARWQALIDREAIGDPLDQDERAFVIDHEAAHPELADERAMFEAAIASLREQLDGEEDELTIARHAAAALERHRAERERADSEQTGGRSRLWLAAVAVAAGLALWFGLRQIGASDDQPKLRAGNEPEQRQPPERADPQPVAPRPGPAAATIDPIGRLSMIVSDDPLELGATFEPGASITVERACVSWSAPTAVVCFEGPLRSLVGAASGERRLRLESGRLVAALDPLGPGQRFTIETPLGSASAIGTVFAVELDHDDAWVTVIEGRVELRDPAVRTLTVGQRARLGGEIVQLDPLPAAIEPLVELAELLRANPDADLTGPDAAPPVDPSSDASKPASAKQLAAAAQRERAAKNYDETARLYRELLRHHGDSPEAANVPVRLGDLLASTGDHQGALEAYELYLDRGAKPLAPEAEYGRIQALQALGRATEERAAIEAFIAARPDDYRNAELRDRLAVLLAKR